jgi:hypothetical protein
LAEVDVCAGPFRQLEVSGDEVGMQVALDDVLDLPASLTRGVEVQRDVPLRVNDGRDAAGSYDVGGVGKAPEEELLDLH